MDYTLSGVFDNHISLPTWEEVNLPNLTNNHRAGNNSVSRYPESEKTSDYERNTYTAGTFKIHSTDTKDNYANTSYADFLRSELEATDEALERDISTRTEIGLELQNEHILLTTNNTIKSISNDLTQLKIYVETEGTLDLKVIFSSRRMK